MFVQRRAALNRIRAEAPDPSSSVSVVDFGLDERRRSVQGSIASSALMAGALGGLPAVIALLSLSVEMPPTIRVSYFVAFLVLAVGAMARNRLSAQTRVLILLAVLFAVGTVGTLTRGLHGLGLMTLALFAVLAALLLGAREGRLALAGMLLVLGASGFAATTGRLTLTTLEGSAREAVGFSLGAGLFGALAVACLGRFRIFLDRSIAQQAHLNIALTKANEKLRQELLRTQAAEEERQRVEEELRESLSKVISGFLPICARCKSIRHEEEWTALDVYVAEHGGAQFSHGICDSCYKRFYSEWD